MRKRAQFKMPSIKPNQKPRKSYSKHITFVLVLSAFFLVLLFNFYFNFTYGYYLNTDNQGLSQFYLLGPDPYYNVRSIQLTLESGIYPWMAPDDLLNYPVGALGSARPPLMNMITIGFSWFLEPFMTQTEAVGYSMQVIPCIFGALLVFPVYFIGKSVFNKKVGIVSALLVALIPIHISAGHGSAYGLFDHDALNILIFALVWAFFIRGLQQTDTRKVLLYGCLTGVSLAALSMVWVSSQFLFSSVALAFLVIATVNVFRSKSNLNISILILSSLSIGVLLYLPLRVNAVNVSLLMLVIGFSIFLHFTERLRIPWIITMPILVGFAASGVTFLYLIRDQTEGIFAGFRSLSVIIFGSGIYGSQVDKTIAEATFFDFSRMAMSFGPTVFLMAGVCFFYLMYYWFRHRDRSDILFLVITYAIGISVLTTAGRFLNDIIPLIVVFSGFLIVSVVDLTNLKGMVKRIKAMSGIRRLYRGIKIQNIAGVSFVVFLVVLPNTYMALDGAIPRIASQELWWEGYEPVFSTSFYKESYWMNATNWLAQQDLDIERPEDRPGFISWWDYGFYTVSSSGHPVVADNFQNGIPPASNFLPAETEEEATAVLIVRLLEGELKRTGLSNNTKEVILNYLPNYTLQTTVGDEIFNRTVTPGTDLINILENPEEYAISYGKLISEAWHSNATVGLQNAKYRDAVSQIMSLSTEEIIQFYIDIQEATGYSIRYFGVEGYYVN